MQRHLTRRATGALVAGALTLAGAAALPQAAGAATDATATPAAVSPAASSAGATLVTAAAYRGAEHAFMVSNVVTARAAGVNSAGAKAALAVLHTNVEALATALTVNAPAKAPAVASLLTTRDLDELAYAAASLGVHQKKSGAKTKQAQALQSLGASETAIGQAIAALYPDTSAKDAAAALKLVDVADEAALEAQSRTGVDRFPKVLAASTALAAVTTSLAAEEAVVGKIPGDLLDGNTLVRIAGAIVATQHVYMVGQFLVTAIAAGNGSGQAKAAEYWVNINTDEVTAVLAAEGLNPDLVNATWRGHITGYRLYVAYIKTGHKGDLSQAQQWFSGYESTIGNEAALKIPGLSAAGVSSDITVHVVGTEQVARELKAGNPQVFADAEMGAQHLVGVFSGFAENAKVSNLETAKLRQSSHLAHL